MLFEDDNYPKAFNYVDSGIEVNSIYDVRKVHGRERLDITKVIKRFTLTERISRKKLSKFCIKLKEFVEFVA